MGLRGLDLDLLARAETRGSDLRNHRGPIPDCRLVCGEPDQFFMWVPAARGRDPIKINKTWTLSVHRTQRRDSPLAVGSEPDGRPAQKRGQDKRFRRGGGLSSDLNPRPKPEFTSCQAALDTHWFPFRERERPRGTGVDMLHSKSHP